MSDITINRPMQVGLLAAALAAVVAAILKQLPEIQRYLRIESM